MKRRKGFALVEALVVVGAVVVLGVMLFLYLGRTYGRASRTSCVSNLKQIGVSFRLFENDHDGLFPQRVSQTNGGTLEIVATASSLAHFLTISNELSGPKVLVCPSDTRLGVQTWESLKPTNVSYAVFLDTSTDNPGAPLGSDRNLILDGSPKRVMQINNPGKAVWGTNIHFHAGNLLMRDGSAMQTTDKMMRERIGVAQPALAGEKTKMEGSQGLTNSSVNTNPVVAPDLKNSGSDLVVTNRLAYPE
jgi:competence protein ComGC